MRSLSKTAVYLAAALALTINAGAQNEGPPGSSDGVVVGTSAGNGRFEVADHGDYPEAAASILEILRSDPGNTAALYELATTLVWETEYEVAIETYRRLLELQPHNTGLHHEIGMAFLFRADKTGDSSYRRDAITEFETSLEHDPTNCASLKQIGAAHLRLGELEEARHRLDEAVQTCPEDHEAAKLLARTLAAQGEFATAIPLIRDLAQWNRAIPDLRWELADMLMRSGDLDGAEAEYRDLLSEYPRDTGCHMALGRLLLWRGDLTEAEQHFRTALWTDIGSPDPYAALGEVASQRGKWSEAVSHYENALQVEPGSAAISEALGQARWRAGPGMRSEYVYYDASRGLSSETLLTEGDLAAPEPTLWTVGHRRNRFFEVGGPERSRIDYFSTVRQPLTPWLEATLGYTHSRFPDGDQSDEQLQGWLVTFDATPFARMGVTATYSRSPVSESLATIASEYYSDAVTLAGSYQILDGLRVGAHGCSEWRNGTFDLGYWNQYHGEWVALATMEDQSRRTNARLDLLYELRTVPLVSFTGGISNVRSFEGEHVPYWAPASFTKEELAVHVSNRLGTRFTWHATLRGNHVHEGREWGYGATLSMVARIGGAVEVGVSGTIDEVGTDVPWDGKSLSVSMSLR